MYVYLWQEPIQYDGTNGSYIVNTWLGGAPYSIISDTGTVLTIAVEDSNNRVVVLNGWLIKGWGNSLGPTRNTWIVMWKCLHVWR